MIKKLQSRKEQEKKHKKQQRWLGIGLIFIMFGSVFGVVVAFFSTQDPNEPVQETYLGYDLNQGAGFYILTVGNNNIYLNTDPNNFNSLDYSINISKMVTMFVGNPLYIDSSDSYSYQTLEQNLFTYANRIVAACIDELDCSNDNLPIKTCEDNIIIVKESSENKIYEDNNCIYIEGNYEDVTALTDIFLLRVFGIN